MQRLRDMLDSDDPVVAEAARLVRAVDDLDPPQAVLARVREMMVPRGGSGKQTAPAIRAGARDDAEHEAAAMMIGSYRVTGAIGQGRMATVHAARHALLGRPAVIKVLSPELSQQRDIVQRFFTEARATTAIRHPGIVEIYDFGWTADGAAFIAMEQLDGETLAQRSRRGRMEWRVALAFARQIAGALFAAHVRGIVHRDLTPGNVFLIRDREVPGGERIKLLDFGIAKLTGHLSPAANLTQAGAILGTPAYMAPEQCSGVAVDHRADLYALGCVLFELITGRPPFVGETSGDVLAAHIHAPVPAVATPDGTSAAAAPAIEVPRAVGHLIQQLLAKSPDERVQTADQLIRAIDAITGRAADARSVDSSAAYGAPPANTTLSGAAGARSRLRLAATRRPGRAVALLAAAAAAAILVVAARHHGDGPPVPAAQPGASTAGPVPPAPVRSPGEAAPPTHAAGDSTAPAPVSPAAPAASPPEPTPAPAAPAASPPEHPSPPVRTAPRAPRPPPASSIELTIDSDPSGAEVVVAGSVLGTTPLHRTLARPPGHFTVVIRLAGYRDRIIIPGADRAITERIVLARVPPHVPRSARDRSVNPFEP